MSHLVVAVVLAFFVTLLPCTQFLFEERRALMQKKETRMRFKKKKGKKEKSGDVGRSVALIDSLLIFCAVSCFF